MEELITAVKEVLEAATAQGQDLEGTVINDQENIMPDDAETLDSNDRLPVMITISEKSEILHTFKENYDYRTGQLYLIVLAPVMKKEESCYRIAKQRCKQIVNKLAKVIINNRNLTCTSYPNGVSFDEEKTKITDITYGFTASGPWLVFARCVFETDYLYRNFQLSLT
jgi:hypothetical protein